MRKPGIILAAVFFLAAPAAPALPSPFDHSRFDEVLKRYVDDRGLVDYRGIAKDPRFSAYLESLGSAQPGSLSENGRLAFWINAYNAVMIDKVIRRKPRKSVRETFFPGVWTSTSVFTARENTVAGRQLSPDDIEHGILRKEFQDPRIHFAVICASRSCPPLPRTAYTAQNVQARLEEETRAYLNSARGTRIDRPTHTLFLSKLFDWFADDFVKKAGSVQAFIRPYLGEEARRFLDGKPKIDFLHYDWALNAREPVRD